MIDPFLLRAVLRARAQDSDEAQTREIDAHLRPRLRRYFARGPWPPDEADDLVQKTLALVFKNLGTLERPDLFLPWIFAIARNVKNTEIRERGERTRVEAGGLELVGDPPDRPGRGLAEETAVDEERLSALRAALDRIAPRQRQCLLLRVREDMTYEEIAATLRLSVHTVRNHIAQAKESLRRRLGAEPGRAR